MGGNKLTADIRLLRGSELSSFKRCPQQWYWAWHKGLRRKVEKQDALWTGTGVHLALAEYYIPGLKRGVHPRETWEKYAVDTRAQIRVQNDGVVDDELEATWEDARELIGNLLDEYVKHGGDESWNVLAPEQRFSVPIPAVKRGPNGKWVADKSRGPRLTFVGTFDLPIRDEKDGKVKIIDHKTAARIETTYLAMDPQANGYCAVGTHTLREQGLIGPREVVKGMLYNFIRKGKIDERPRDAEGYSLNKDGTRSKRQPAPLFERVFIERNSYERNEQIIRMSHDIGRIERTLEDHEVHGIPLMKVQDKSCTWCPFFDLCELDNSGGDVEYFIESVFTPVDMYHDHREGAVNSKTSVENQRGEGN